MRGFILGAIVTVLAYTVGIDRVIVGLEQASNTVRVAAQAGFSEVERVRAARAKEAP